MSAAMAQAWRDRAVRLLLIVSLILAGLVPQGWMPQASARGIEMVLCTANGAGSIIVDVGRQADPDDRQAPGTAGPNVCIFAAVHGVAMPPPAAGFTGPMGAFLATDPSAGLPSQRPADLAVYLPPSQAPPLSI